MKLLETCQIAMEMFLHLYSQTLSLRLELHLGSGGKIKAIGYNPSTRVFQIKYTSAIGINYEGEWKSTGDSGGAILRAANIHVIAVYPDDTTRDVTDLIQYGIMQSDNSIIMNHGAIAVDRALTANEGEKLNMVFEQSPLMSDGLADGNVTATWYLAHYSSVRIPGSSGGGCDAFSLSSAGLILGFALMKLRRR